MAYNQLNESNSVQKLWICPQCTLKNNFNSSKCAACNCPQQTNPNMNAPGEIYKPEPIHNNQAPSSQNKDQVIRGKCNLGTQCLNVKVGNCPLYHPKCRSGAKCKLVKQKKCGFYHPKSHFYHNTHQPVIAQAQAYHNRPQPIPMQQPVQQPAPVGMMVVQQPAPAPVHQVIVVQPVVEQSPHNEALLNMQQQPQFQCRRCRGTQNHNNRTRSILAKGRTDIYCDACHRQWIRRRNGGGASAAAIICFIIFFLVIFNGSGSS